jgi:ribonuclease T1
MKSLFLLIASLFLFFDCQPKQSDGAGYEKSPQNYNSSDGGRSHHKKHKPKQFRQNKYRQNRSDEQSETVTDGTIPQKVRDVLAYIKANHRAMDGYVGGRQFKNLEKHLQKRDTNGQKITYQEWDVNPKQQGRNRGTERLITGSDGRVWFTSDHYSSFVEVK